MPNTKISDDPSASALAGTEIVPVIQGGVNKKTTIEAILNDRDVVQRDPITGALTINNVPINIPTPYTRSEFFGLTVALYAGYTVLISDVKVEHSDVQGVLVRANNAGTAWIPITTPSFLLVDVPAATQIPGWKIFVSDLGGGSYWYSNGTRYYPIGPVILQNITSNIVLAASSTSAKVAAQVTIPLIDGKSIWPDGYILRIDHYVEKTGTADSMHTAIYIGDDPLVKDDTDTNTLITTVSSGTPEAQAISRKILRKSATVVRSLSPEAIVGFSGSSTTKSFDIPISSLDAATSYVDATIRVTAVTTDTVLTLVGHTVTLVAGGS